MKNNSPYKLIVLLAFVIWGSSAYAQQWIWAKGEGGIGNDAATSVTSDENGNVYVTGNLAGNADFSGTTYQGKGRYDVFIAKYDGTGNLLWVKTAGGKGDDLGNCIRYKNGALYVCGYFTDTAYFESTAIISHGETDIFVAKYDANGNLVWVRNGGGQFEDIGTAVDVDGAGNVYAGGYYVSAARFDTAGISSTNVYTESVVVKYSRNGVLQWAKTTTGNAANQLTGLSCYSNSVYIEGFFGKNLEADTLTVASASPSYDIYIGKLNDNGNAVWLKRAGSNYEDAGEGIACDRNGNVFVTGYFSGTAYFDSNAVTYVDYNDVFVAKYDSLGNNLWVQNGGGPHLDVGYGVACDDAGNVFATGMFDSAMNFGLQSLVGTDRDVFVVSYDATGNLRWVTEAGGVQVNCAFGITVKGNNHLAICGYYAHSFYFGSMQIDLALYDDLFIAEYNPPFVNSINETDNAGFNFYPNPAGNYCFLKPADAKAEYRLEVYDIAGARVLSTFIYGDYMLDISGLNNGMYLLQLTGKSGTVLKKLIKE